MPSQQVYIHAGLLIVERIESNLLGARVGSLCQRALFQAKARFYSRRPGMVPQAAAVIANARVAGCARYCVTRLPICPHEPLQNQVVPSFLLAVPKAAGRGTGVNLSGKWPALPGLMLKNHNNRMQYQESNYVTFCPSGGWLSQVPHHQGFQIINPLSTPIVLISRDPPAFSGQLLNNRRLLQMRLLSAEQWGFFQKLDVDSPNNDSTSCLG